MVIKVLDKETAGNVFDVAELHLECLMVVEILHREVAGLVDDVLELELDRVGMIGVRDGEAILSELDLEGFLVIEVFDGRKVARDIVVILKLHHDRVGMTDVVDHKVSRLVLNIVQLEQVNLVHMLAVLVSQVQQHRILFCEGGDAKNAGNNEFHYY